MSPFATMLYPALMIASSGSRAVHLSTRRAFSLDIRFR